VEVDLLRQRVKVRLEDQPETIAVYPNAEIAILRSGKAKKNDPPIPADLAPISGAGKRRRTEPVEEAIQLDPIRFRYLEEVIVEEPVKEEEPASEEAPAARNNRRRNRKKNPAKKEAAPAEGVKQEAPAPEQAAAPADKAKKNRYHHRRHHRRPKKEGNAQ